jgi:hypothetical protein
VRAAPFLLQLRAFRRRVQRLGAPARRLEGRVVVVVAAVGVVAGGAAAPRALLGALKMDAVCRTVARATRPPPHGSREEFVAKCVARVRVRALNFTTWPAFTAWWEGRRWDASGLLHTWQDARGAHCTALVRGDGKVLSDVRCERPALPWPGAPFTAAVNVRGFLDGVTLEGYDFHRSAVLDAAGARVATKSA